VISAAKKVRREEGGRKSTEQSSTEQLQSSRTPASLRPESGELQRDGVERIGAHDRIVAPGSRDRVALRFEPIEAGSVKFILGCTSML
jgi:hypothetical protein